ncbi:TAXI family TRAP transporter solute-binding subunit [Paracoccus sp. Z330]|uniref:TAXI family TRAP transporter solute-binding subunit n=1 Tax=Paracoccus onchidii TaxID=3017813 RepID=A0ABT4ZII1_9RHOB|nr:TAXI family TRAP transporter solute-binding subunit [Paracoccus onchidii]MDB6179171.1 TAXI family TRAP transporter solute-binding subunit [Paracoccus onchidii]
MTFTYRAMILSTAIAMSGGVAKAQDIIFSGVSTTSDDYQLGVVWSGIAREAGLSMTVVENGTVAGMRKAALGEVDMVGVGAPHYLDAVDGTGSYSEDPEDLREGYKTMKAILALPVGMAQYVARSDAGIESFKDLAGHKVGIGRPGGNAGKVTETLFQIHGIADSVQAQAIEYGPALDQMAASTMDATLVWGSIPTAVIDNASRQMELRFVSPDPTTLEEFQSTITNGEYYVYQRVPADVIEKAYEGRVAADGDAYFWTFPYQIMVRGEIDEEIVYQLTKALWENIQKVNDASAGLSLVNLDEALTSISAELHPGAARYYKEIGRM